MTKEAQIATIRGFIEEEELILASMRERVRLLNPAILKLEKELEADKARLHALEVEQC